MNPLGGGDVSARCYTASNRSKSSSPRTDLRKLRGVWLAAGDDDIAHVMGPQGPDALGVGLRASAMCSLAGRAS